MSEMETSSIKDFSEWILKISDGELGEEDDDNKITIPNDLIIQSMENPMQDIIDSIYLDLKVSTKIQVTYKIRQFLPLQMKLLRN